MEPEDQVTSTKELFTSREVWTIKIEIKKKNYKSQKIFKQL